jgi:hypothetical protein
MKRALSALLSLFLSGLPCMQAAAQVRELGPLPAEPLGTVGGLSAEPSPSPSAVDAPSLGEAAPLSALPSLQSAPLESPSASLPRSLSPRASKDVSHQAPAASRQAPAAAAKLERGLSAAKDEGKPKSGESGAADGSARFDGSRKGPKLDLPDPEAEAPALDLGQPVSGPAPVRPPKEAPKQAPKEAPKKVEVIAPAPAPKASPAPAASAAATVAASSRQPLGRGGLLRAAGVVVLQGALLGATLFAAAHGVVLPFWTKLAAIGLPSAAIAASAAVALLPTDKSRKIPTIALAAATMIGAFALSPAIKAAGFFSLVGIATSITMSLISTTAMKSIEAQTGRSLQPQLGTAGKKVEARGTPAQHLLITGALGPLAVAAALAGGWEGLAASAILSLSQKWALSSLRKYKAKPVPGRETADPLPDIKIPKSAAAVERLRQTLEKELSSDSNVLAVWSERDIEGDFLEVRVRDASDEKVAGIPKEYSGVPVRIGALAAPAAPAASEPPKAEPPKTEPPKTEPPKTDPPKVEPLNAAPAAAAQPASTQPPAAEPPKAEPPKAAPSKAVPPPVPAAAAAAPIPLTNPKPAKESRTVLLKRRSLTAGLVRFSPEARARSAEGWAMMAPQLPDARVSFDARTPLGVFRGARSFVISSDRKRRLLAVRLKDGRVAVADVALSRAKYVDFNAIVYLSDTAGKLDKAYHSLESHDSEGAMPEVDELTPYADDAFASVKAFLGAYAYDAAAKAAPKKSEPPPTAVASAPAPAPAPAPATKPAPAPAPKPAPVPAPKPTPVSSPLDLAKTALYIMAGGSADSGKAGLSNLTAEDRIEYFRTEEFKNWVASEKAAGRTVYWLKDIDKTQAAGDIFTFFFEWRARNGGFTPEQNEILRQFLAAKGKLTPAEARTVARQDASANAHKVIELWEAGRLGLLDFWSGAYWPTQAGLTREEKARQTSEFAKEYASRIYPDTVADNRALRAAGVEVVFVSNGDEELAKAVAPLLGNVPENVVGSKLLYEADGRSNGKLHTYEIYDDKWSAKPQPGKVLNWRYWLHERGVDGSRAVVAGMDGDSAAADGGVMIYLSPVIGNFMVNTPDEPDRVEQFKKFGDKYGAWERGRFIELSPRASAMGALP